MRDTLETKLGVFFALVFIMALIILEMLGGVPFFQHGYHLTAYFKNVQELKRGDPVKMAGVLVGRVEDLTLDNEKGQARVFLYLHSGSAVKDDSKAYVKFTGLMGQNYISIDLGSATAKTLLDGNVMQSGEQPDLSQIMAKLDNAASGVENLTKSFSGEKIDKLLGPLMEFIENNKESLSVTFTNMRSISDNIAQGKGTVGRLINEDTLYVTAMNTVSNLQGTAGDIKRVSDEAYALLTDANQVVDQVKAGQGTVGKLVYDEALYRQATNVVETVQEILNKMNNGTGTVGQLINDPSTLRNLKLSLQKLDKATESLEDTGPLSVFGTMATSLF